MYTRCPTCSTCFRVTDRHLAIANGKVRCGQCQLVFNAPEHAIDDLPVNQITKPSVPPVMPPAKAETKQPLTQKKDITDNPLLSSLRSNTEEKLEPSTTQEITNEVKEEVIELATDTPVFDSNAKMIADESTLNINEVENIDLDNPSTIQNSNDDEDDDDLFNDDFDLNSAIDELTDFTEEDDDEDISEENIEVETKQYIPDSNDDDVFNTDAYESTSASSVADIMNEMEGQLSLDIPEPTKNDEYDANTEFDFLKTDNEEDNLPENENVEEKNIVDEFEFIEDGDERNASIDENVEISSGETELSADIEDDELFDQIDISDLRDEDIKEDIVLETSHMEESNLEDTEQKLTNENLDDIPFQLRNDIESLQTHSKRYLHPLLSVFLIIILLVLSFSQFAYFRAHDLVKLSPSTQPLLEAFCDTVACNYSGPRDIKQIQLISRDVRLHPKEKKALLISAAMINNAYFSQPYPDIHIRLSDISGNIIAERIFNAKTYMGKLSNPFLLMKSKTPVHINFEVVDPGKDAINFEFTFL